MPELTIEQMIFRKREHTEVSRRLRSRYAAAFAGEQYYMLRETLADPETEGPVYRLMVADAIPARPKTPWIPARYMQLIIDARGLEEMEDDWEVTQEEKEAINRRTNYGAF